MEEDGGRGGGKEGARERGAGCEEDWPRFRPCGDGTPDPVPNDDDAAAAASDAAGPETDA
eukprot:3219879-Rhodomonas_salina.2